MDCSLPGSSVHGILQVSILEWVAFSFSRGSSQPRNWTWVSCIAGRFFTAWAKSDAYKNLPTYIFLFGRVRFLILWFNNWLTLFFPPLGITHEICGKEMYYIIFIVIFLKLFCKALVPCRTMKFHMIIACTLLLLLLLLLSRFSHVQPCATREMAAQQAPWSLGFSRQEHWSGLPFPSPMHESEKWKWSRSVVSDS